MTKRVQVLHLEDSALDAELIHEQLQADGVPCEVVLANGRAAFEAALTRGPVELILLDYNLPDYDGLSALELARTRQPGVPLIILSGALGDEMAVECLRCGATD
ncbi:MAG: response regulator, partial [Verrucomicrobia bacterium]|nr:response regulator [Verrucomicrobiota bacterium]